MGIKLHTDTLKNFCLGVPNSWSTYITERCYLNIFFVLFKSEIPEANYILIKFNTLILFFNKENELFLYLRTSKRLSLRVFVRCELS